MTPLRHVGGIQPMSVDVSAGGIGISAGCACSSGGMTVVRRTGYHLGVYLLALLALLGVTRLVDTSAHPQRTPNATQTQ